MFGELRVFLFFFFFFFFRSVHGWMGLDVWVNVFTMSFLCADSGPWRKMSRAWPPMSAITTSSGSTCPSHQESAWGAAEARQERDIVEVVRKGIVVCKCWSLCWTHLQMFSVSTVLGGKAWDVEQSWKHVPSFLAVAHYQFGQKRTTQRKRHVRWVEGFPVCLFLCFRSVHGWMGMDVWVNVFTMSFLCADSGPWRKMSRAWPPMSAITTSSGSTCPSHQESAWGAAEARQERDIVEVVRKGIVVCKCWSLCWTHLQMFSVSTVLGGKAWDVEQSWKHLPSFLAVAHYQFGQKRTNQRKRHVWWVEGFPVCLFVLGVCMGEWEWMCEWMSSQCHSCAQTLDRGERCLGPDLQCPR